MSNWTPEQFRDYAAKRLKDEQRTRTEIYEASNSVARLQDTVGEPQARASLVATPRRKKGRIRRAKVRISIISFRHRLLDSDNLVAGAKQLRDTIAADLECSDAESSGIEWEYEQCLTRGTEGTLIRIESL